MRTRPFKIIVTASWVSLVVCFLVLGYIAFTAANTVLVSGTAERDKYIQEVRSSTDIHYLQERAATFIGLGEFTSSLSMLLCRLALGALVLAVLCSVITLVQVRKARRLTDEPKTAG